MSEIIWKIPKNIGYESYIKAIGAFFQKKADTTPLKTKDIAVTIGSEPKSISEGIGFLVSINVLEGNKTEGYKLTEKGSKYAEAVYNEDGDAIKKSWNDIVENTFLKSLSDYIEINKKDLTLEGLFKHIRTKGRFPVGNGPTGMTNPCATGARTLLQIFKNTGMLPNDFDLGSTRERATTKKSKQKANKVLTKQKTTPKKTKPENDEDWVSYSVDDFKMSMHKGIDLDTFTFIQNEVVSNLNFWKTKFVVKNNDSE